MNEYVNITEVAKSSQFICPKFWKYLYADDIAFYFLTDLKG